MEGVEGNGLTHRLKEIGIEEEKIAPIYWWLTNYIFNQDGELIYVQNGRLKKEYPHKQLKRMYNGLPSKIVPLLHMKELRREWGRLVDNTEDISFIEYRKDENRIIRYVRWREDWSECAGDRYGHDTAWFIDLIDALCSGNAGDAYFILHYAAFLIQKRCYRERTNRLLILHSLVQGVGKSLFSSIISRILNGVAVHPEMLKGKFDAHRLGLKNLCIIEEGEALDKGHYAMMKALITSDRMESPVKFSMEDRVIPSSFECIVTTNKRPSSLRDQSNRRDIIIECKGLSDERKRRLFENLKVDDQLIGNIAKMLQSVEVDKGYVAKYQQKDDVSLLVAVNEIQLFVKLFLEYGLLPYADLNLVGDWRLARWGGRTDTGMSKRDWYRLYKIYSDYMNSRMSYGYRFFLEEMKRICGDGFDSSADIVLFDSRNILRKRYESIFIRDTVSERDIDISNRSFKMLMETV